ncbi:MAG: hypothetical protein FWD34_07780 [Oscillospiraceae bacterium]|nr:hypothetical protein [Oscillospiraceae bacterium]
MKKLLAFFLTAVMLISVTACDGTGNASDTERTTTATTISTSSSEITTEETTVTIFVSEPDNVEDDTVIGLKTGETIILSFMHPYDDNQSDKSMEEILTILLDKNVVCFFMFNQSNSIPLDFDFSVYREHINWEPDEDGDYRIINNSFFNSYIQFYDFIKSVYTSEKADELLSNGYFYEKNNELYASSGFFGWTYMFDPFYFGYDFVITNESIDFCEFILYVTVPEGFDDLKIIEFLGVALNIDGEWRLEDMYVTIEYE